MRQSVGLVAVAVGAWVLGASAAGMAQSRAVHAIAQPPGHAPDEATAGAANASERVETPDDAGAPSNSAAAPLLVVDVVSAPPAGLRVADVRGAIARELGWTVVPPAAATAERAAARLRVRFEARGTRVVMDYRNALGPPVHRVARLSGAAREALETVAFVAGNVARDEALDVVAALTTRRGAQRDGATSAGSSEASSPTSAEEGAPQSGAAASGAMEAGAARGVVGANGAGHPHRVSGAYGVALPAHPLSFAIDPETLTLATDPPDVRLLRDDRRALRPSTAAGMRHGGVLIAFGASAGAGAIADRAVWTANAGLALRWRTVSVRFDATYTGLPPPASGGAGGGRVWVVPLLAAVLPAGPLAIDVGFGMGVLGSTVTLLPHSLMAERTDVFEIAPAARASVGAAWPIHRAVEIVARVDGHVGIGSASINGLESIQPVAAQLSASLGVQGRWSP